MDLIWKGAIVRDQDLRNFTSFSGGLDADGNSISLSFSVRINHRGEVEFDLGHIALTRETSFIMKCWDDDRSKVNCFTLSGKSADGIEFKTEDLLLNSLGHESSRDQGSWITLNGSCSRAVFHWKLVEPTPTPVICMRLKGFQNFGHLRQNCKLGTVNMTGNHSIEDPDTVTGSISVKSDDETLELHAWRKETDKLLEHIRRVMSFASATVLQAPITEFLAGSELEVVALSQTRQAPAFMQTFHHLDHQPIFDAAVNSFFNPPRPDIKNLFFAIEWFAMDATYNEVRLVNAMTALENLVVSNLGDSDAMIRPPKEFDKMRTKLRQVIKKCVEKWSPEETEKAKEVVKDLNDKLADLNRRSIFQKLKTLSDRWSVPFDGISDDRIRAAKKARDLIVHRGHYYEDENGEREDLWEHVTVIREIVVRFLLTAIGYEGRYLSYLGGYHDAQFPPQKRLGV